MIVDISLRLYFTKSYEIVLRESGILPENMPLKLLPQRSIFTDPKTCDSFKQQKFQRLKNQDLILPLITNTIGIKDLVKKLIDCKVLELLDSYQICWKCEKVWVDILHKKCPKCGALNLEISPRYKLPYLIEEFWTKNHRKFLEAFCYNVIKLENLPLIKLITSGTEIGEIGEKYFTYAELDVAITFYKKSKQLNNNNVLILICTYNPRQKSERQQAEKMIKLNYPFIFVTTDSSIPDKIRQNKNYIKGFTKVYENLDFPKELINLIKNLEFD